MMTMMVRIFFAFDYSTVKLMQLVIDKSDVEDDESEQDEQDDNVEDWWPWKDQKVRHVTAFPPLDNLLYTKTLNPD